MTRRRLLLGGLAAVLLAGLAFGGWYGYTRYLAPSPAQSLVGRWEGNGRLTSRGAIEVKPGPDGPGGKESLTLNFTTNIQAEFRPDGTYSWDEKADAGVMSLTIKLPKPGEPAPTWTVTRAGPPSSTLHLAQGDFELVFHDRDTFTLRSSGAESSAELTFKRKP